MKGFWERLSKASARGFSLKVFRYGEKGFTLIELLIVIAILGVLAAVAVPNVAKFIGAGKEEAAKSELAAIQAAMDAGWLHKGVASTTAIGAGTIASGDITAGITDLGGTNYFTGTTCLFPDYIRTRNTSSVKKGTSTLAQYGWDTNGQVYSTAINPTTGAYR